MTQRDGAPAIVASALVPTSRQDAGSRSGGAVKAARRGGWRHSSRLPAARSHKSLRAGTQAARLLSLDRCSACGDRRIARDAVGSADPISAKKPAGTRNEGRDKTLKVRVEKQIGASVLSIETGYLAKQAAGSCLVQYGETVVLTAVADGPPRPGVSDFFPLTCDYRERTAAAGKFPGGFLKREGRPTMKETLTARLMDRPIRPLFPAWFHDEVQIQSFVLASDRQNDADVLAMNGASAALGPFAACRSRARSARCAWDTSTASSCRFPRRTSSKRAIST